MHCPQMLLRGTQIIALPQLRFGAVQVWPDDWMQAPEPWKLHWARQWVRSYTRMVAMSYRH